MYRFDQRFVNYNHILWIVNVGMYSDRFTADPVVGSDRCAHSLWTILRESLNIFTCFECHICEEQGSSLGTLTSRTGRQLSLKAASVGGGRIRVTEIDGVPADFGGDSNTLIIHNEDTPGCIAEVTMALALRRINIASMQVFRAAAGGYAVMVLECDSHIPHALERQLAVMPGLLKVTCLNVDEPEETEE